MPQSYANHRRFEPWYHYILATLLVVTVVGAAVNVFGSLGTENLYSASLILVLTAAVIIIFFLMRAFALKAQDRAIRAEENLRHYVMTGQMLDPRVTVRQIVGLRFASDDEFVDLARRAAEEGLSEDEIKRSVTVWKADLYRV